MIDLRQGDCLELMKDIPDGSIDLVLTDPPYGTMKGADLDGWNGKATDWDNAIEPERIFPEIERVLRQNGKSILFSQEPYSSKLIVSAHNELPFLQKAIWYKNNHANPLAAKKALVSLYEDILIFGKPHDPECTNSLRAYFANILEYIGLKFCKDINKVIGHRKAEHTFYVTSGKKKIKNEIGGKADHVFRTGSSQFSLCSKETYNEIVSVFGIDKMEGFMEYDELQMLNQKYLPTFNLWQGGKSKSNVFQYSKDSDHYHPTQKPVALLKDLIQTYSNPGDTVLDFTMGSGSTGVACVKTGRNFIGIELGLEYFEIAKKRIEDAEDEMRQLQIF